MYTLIYVSTNICIHKSTNIYESINKIEMILILYIFITI